MPPKKYSGDGERRDSSPAATSVMVNDGTPGGGVSHQEMRDMFMDVAKSLMDNIREMVRMTVEEFDGKLKACEDKLLKCMEAKLLSYIVLVPHTPGQEERNELGPLGDISRPSSTTPVNGRTSTMLDVSQQDTLRVVDKYDQEHG